MVEQTAETGVLYCANHPTVETLLRCNKCGKPICMKCAQQTPVGYRCKDCVRTQQNVYYNAQSWDNPIALAVSLIVTIIATPLVSIVLGFLGLLWGAIFAFMAGSGAGGLLAQIIRQAIGRRRGRYLRYFALAGIVLGVAGSLLAMAIFLRFPLFNPAMLIFAFLAITTAYQILK